MASSSSTSQPAVVGRSGTFFLFRIICAIGNLECANRARIYCLGGRIMQKLYSESSSSYLAYSNSGCHILKLLLIGDSGVGKSSMLLRFCDEKWTVF